MNINKLRIILAVFVIFSSGVSVYAENKNVGARASQFLLIPMGGRPSAMGNAFSALATDVNSIYWNPAGMSYASSQEILFQHTEFIEDQNLEYGAYVHPHLFLNTPFEGNYGLGITYFNKGNFNRYTINSGENRQSLGTFSASDWQISALYARTFLPWLSAGASLKWIHQTIDSYSGNAFATDIGFRATTPYPNLYASFVIQNAGTRITLNKEGSPTPLTFRVGAAYTTFRDQVNLVLDLIKTLDNPFAITVGGEYWALPLFALRVGYDSSKDAGIGLTGGAGFRKDNFSIDYAYSPYGDLKGVHKISGQYRFNISKQSYKQKSDISPPRIHKTKSTSRKVLTKPKKHTTIQYTYEDGMTAFINEDYTQAVRIFKRVQPSPEEEKDIYMAMGISYMSLNDNINAKKYLEKALQEDPQNKTIEDLLDILE